MVKRGIHRAIVLILSAAVPLASTLAAEDHVVPAAELHQQLLSGAQARKTNLAKSQSFFSLAPVQGALQAGKLDGGQVKKAVALLSDEELARLASYTDELQTDVQGGALSNQELTYIVIALGTAVLILVIVAAR